MQLPGQVQGRPPRCGALTTPPHPAQHPSPAFVSISKCQAKIPFQESSARSSENLFYFTLHIYLFLPPPPSSDSSGKKRLTQTRPRKDKQRRPHSGLAEQNGGIFRQECGSKGGTWNPWIERRPVRAEDCTSFRHKGSNWGLLAKPPTPACFSEATIGKLSCSPGLREPGGF